VDGTVVVDHSKARRLHILYSARWAAPAAIQPGQRGEIKKERVEQRLSSGAVRAHHTTLSQKKAG